jgi:hypothetical protein
MIEDFGFLLEPVQYQRSSAAMHVIGEIYHRLVNRKTDSELVVPMATKPIGSEEQ